MNHHNIPRTHAGDKIARDFSDVSEAIDDVRELAIQPQHSRRNSDIATRRATVLVECASPIALQPARIHASSQLNW